MSPFDSDSPADADGYCTIAGCARGLWVMLVDVCQRLEEENAQESPDIYISWVFRRVTQSMNQIGVTGKSAGFVSGLAATSELRGLYNRLNLIVKAISKDIVYPAKRHFENHEDERAKAQLEIIRIEVNRITGDVDAFLNEMTRPNGSYTNARKSASQPGSENSITVSGSVYGNIINMGDNGSSNFAQGLSGQDLATLLNGLDSHVTKLLPRLDEPDQDEFKTAVDLVKKGARRPDRRKWYDCGVEGVLEAAHKIGEAGLPLLEIVSKITTLLGRS